MKRIGAFVIDLIVGAVIFGATIANSYDSVTGSVPQSKFSDLGMRDVVGLVFLITFVLSYCYLCEKFFGGTVGQRIFKLNSSGKK